MSGGKVRTHANTLGDRNENVAGEITSTVHNMSNTNDNSRTTKKYDFAICIIIKLRNLNLMIGLLKESFLY